LYALIPLLFIIILSAIRPEFVTYNYLPEGAEENTVPVVKLSFKDVLTWAFGLTIPVAIGIYIYTTKQGI
jgi:hypothetical protein